jgi:ApaG protein
MVSALTDGIRVSVETFYLADQSSPAEHHFAFAYRVTIRNESARTVQLLRRHWIISDANQEVTEVYGDGVVGEQPVLPPGAAHTYQSGTHLETSSGTMHGTYEMRDSEGKLFRVAIPLFTLGRAETLH